MDRSDANPDDWHYWLLSFRDGIIESREFFYRICPFVTEENVDDIVSQIPSGIGKLRFWKYVGEMSPRPVLTGVFDSRPRELNEPFIRGLQVLKSVLGSPLTFGDYLFVEQIDLSEELEFRIASKSKPEWIEDTRRRLESVQILLKHYSPKCLSQFVNSPMNGGVGAHEA